MLAHHTHFIHRSILSSRFKRYWFIAATRARVEEFADESVPFLACRDLAVFKAFFDRTRDWADLEEMYAAGSLDVEQVLGVLAHYLGAYDDRIVRLRALSAQS